MPNPFKALGLVLKGNFLDGRVGVNLKGRLG